MSTLHPAPIARWLPVAISLVGVAAIALAAACASSEVPLPARLVPHAATKGDIVRMDGVLSEVRVVAVDKSQASTEARARETAILALLDFPALGKTPDEIIALRGWADLADTVTVVRGRSEPTRASEEGGVRMEFVFIIRDEPLSEGLQKLLAPQAPQTAPGG